MDYQLLNVDIPRHNCIVNSLGGWYGQLYRLRRVGVIANGLLSNRTVAITCPVPFVSPFSADLS
jgi:hypothetical protein